jgi:hypothetical protein
MKVRISYESDCIKEELEGSLKGLLSKFGLRCTDSGMGMGSRDLCFSDEVKPHPNVTYLHAAGQK